MKKPYEKAFFTFVSFENVDILEISDGIKNKQQEPAVPSEDRVEGEWDIL